VLGEEGGKTGNFKACSGILPVKESKNATVLSTSSFVKVIPSCVSPIILTASLRSHTFPSWK